jgi:enamine deaminase RidA (YjgF/YER057c/UK114 family)
VRSFLKARSRTDARSPLVVFPEILTITEQDMTIKLHNPPGIAPPFSCYSHGASTQGDARWLYVSGQVGVTTDGVVPDDPEKQIELAWDNLLAVLADAGMTVKDLVKIDGFITRPDLVPFYQ